MFRWVNSSPVLFAQPLESKNRQRFRRFKSIAEKMSNLLSDRSVLALRSSLELPVERIGKVLDVRTAIALLLTFSVMEDVSRLLSRLSSRLSCQGSRCQLAAFVVCCQPHHWEWPHLCSEGGTLPQNGESRLLL